MDILHSKQQMAQGSFICTEPKSNCVSDGFCDSDSLKIKLNFISRSKGLPTKFCQMLLGFLSQIPPIHWLRRPISSQPRAFSPCPTGVWSPPLPWLVFHPVGGLNRRKAPKYVIISRSKENSAGQKPT